MLTDFQKRKLERYFKFYDTNDNGYIEQEDYEIIARRLAKARGWQEGTPGHDIVMQRFRIDWQLLANFADDNNDAQVTLDEWFAYHEHIFMVDSKFRAGQDDIISTIFATIDINGSGMIHESEFTKFFSLYGLDADTARETFHKIDENGDGVLTRREIAKLFHQFVKSNDPKEPGNWLFGPFE